MDIRYTVSRHPGLLIIRLQPHRRRTRSLRRRIAHRGRLIHVLPTRGARRLRGRAAGRRVSVSRVISLAG